MRIRSSGNWLPFFRSCALVASMPVLAGNALAQAGSDKVLLDVTNYVVEGENPFSAAETAAILAPHLGAHNDINSIDAAPIALEKELRARGYSFHRVILPPQRPTQGIVTLRVLQFPLAEVVVTNNEHFTTENILASLPSLKSGIPPDVNRIAQELSTANEHPAKRLTIQIKESQTADHLDAEVRVRDVPSETTFIAMTGGSRDRDNTLNRNTGYTRLTAGYQNSNLFDRDHSMTLTYTTSPDHLDKVSQYGAFYSIPLYDYQTTISGYWTKSDVDSGALGVGPQSFNVSGRGEFWGFRGSFALPKLDTFSQQLAIALDNRHFESDVSPTGGGATLSTPVGSRPLSLRYTVRNEHVDGGIGAYLEYVGNLSGGSHNSSSAFNAARPGAPHHWTAWRLGVDGRYAFADGWSLLARLRGQYTADPLIPGEQFGIGGPGSVRGLRDRETAGDRGYTLNLEVYAPKLAWGMTPYVFYDMGRRSMDTPVAGMTSKEGVGSIGLGANWSADRSLDLNATLATVINGLSPGTSPVSDSGHTKLNFSVFYRF